MAARCRRNCSTDAQATSPAAGGRGCQRARALSPGRAVFSRAATELPHRVFLGIQRDLAQGRGREVDAELVGQAHQVQQHVGQLECDRFACRRVQPAALLLAQPLEMLEQFADLAGQRHGQVLRRMKLVPVALACKLRQSRRQLFERRGAGRWRHGGALNLAARRGCAASGAGARRRPTAADRRR